MASSAKVLHPTQETLDDPQFFVMNLFNGGVVPSCQFIQTDPHRWGELTLHGYTSGNVFLQDSTGLILAWELSSGRVNLADHDALILFDSDVATNSPYSDDWTRPSMDDWCEIDLGDVVDAHRVSHLSSEVLDVLRGCFSTALSDMGPEGEIGFQVGDTEVRARFADNAFRFIGMDGSGVKYRMSADMFFKALWSIDGLDAD